MLQKKISKIFAIIFITYVLVLKGIPLIVCIYSSFTNWDGMFRFEFIGINNYISVFSDPKTWKLLENTFLLQLHVFFEILIAIIIALVIFYSNIKHKTMIVCLLYLPQLFSGTVISYIFKVFFGYDGTINAILANLGFEPILFLEEAKYSLIIINLCYVWTETGAVNLILYGNLLLMDKSIKDLIVIDGVPFLTKLIYIYFPLMSKTIVGICALNLIFSMSSAFSLIHVLTNGGPAYDTTTFDYAIYSKAFVSGGNIGLASTYSVILIVLFLFVVFSVLIFKRGIKKNETTCKKSN